VGQPTNRGTIVGVVRDFRQVNADQPPFPELYFPVAQNWSQVSELGMTLIVRTTGRPDLLIGAIRASVHDLDPSLAIFNVKTMDQVVGESLSAFTLYLYLMAAFAAVAVILALSGTYGVVAFIANARTREFAIRAALGATRGHVTRLVVAQGLALAAAGLAVGVAGALAAAPLVRGLPVAVRPPDAATMAPIAFAIAVVALIACLVPAWRAERVNPMQALRNE
jgi:ABC-type antimicrobial peptide transport system permease subunit